MSKIDIIINALSVAQNSVWSALNEQALAAARELQAEKQEHQFKYTPYGLRADESGNLSIGELPRKEWVGLTDEEIKKLLDCGRGGLVDIKKAEQMLKEKNT